MLLNSAGLERSLDQSYLHLESASSWAPSRRQSISSIPGLARLILLKQRGGMVIRSTSSMVKLFSGLSPDGSQRDESLSTQLVELGWDQDYSLFWAHGRESAIGDAIDELINVDVGLTVRLRRIPKRIRKNLKGKLRVKTELFFVSKRERVAFNLRLMRLFFIRDEVVNDEEEIPASLLQSYELVWAYEVCISERGLSDYKRRLRVMQRNLLLGYLEFGSQKLTT